MKKILFLTMTLMFTFSIQTFAGETETKGGTFCNDDKVDTKEIDAEVSVESEKPSTSTDESGDDTAK